MWDHRGCPRTGLCTAPLGWEAAWLLALGLMALLGLGLLISRQMCSQQAFSLPRCGSVWFPLGITTSPGPSTNSGQAGGGSVGRPGHSPSEGWAIRPQHDRTAWPRGRSHCLGWRPAHCRAVRKSDTDPCDSGRCHRPGTSAGTHLLPPPCTHRVRLVGHSMAKTPRDLVFKEGACSRLQGQHKGQECGQSCPLPPPLWFS